MRLSGWTLGCVLGLLLGCAAPGWTQGAPLTVTVDVKPGDDLTDPNPINVKAHGKTPVALLCDATVPDVTLVDAPTLLLQATDLAAPGGTEPVRCSVEDVNEDACLDLVCKFETDEVGVTCATTSLTLTGELLDGTLLSGTSLVQPVPCKKGKP